MPQEYLQYVEKNIKVPENYSEIINPDGTLNFDLFMLMFKTALMWNHHYFKPRMAELAKERREFLDKQDPDTQLKYLKLCMLAKLEDEDSFQRFLEPMRSKF
mgnify:CR=1 FL=1